MFCFFCFFLGIICNLFTLIKEIVLTSHEKKCISEVNVNISYSLQGSELYFMKFASKPAVRRPPRKTKLNTEEEGKVYTCK